jgi:hypothetical protein
VNPWFQVEEFSLLLWSEGMEECKSNSTADKKSMSRTTNKIKKMEFREI